jgi:hypothetical protein
MAKMLEADVMPFPEKPQFEESSISREETRLDMYLT